MTTKLIKPGDSVVWISQFDERGNQIGDVSLIHSEDPEYYLVGYKSKFDPGQTKDKFYKDRFRKALPEEIIAAKLLGKYYG